MRGQPTSPAALTILREAAKPGASPFELSQLAVTDPVFAMRVLSLVNSGAFGGRRVTDIRQATSLLGVRGLRSVALSFVISDLAPNSEEGTLALTQSLRRAMLCRLLAAQITGADPETMFAIGLFLEVGLLLAEGEAPSSVRLARLPAQHRVIHEQVSGRTPHPELGASLARHYGLPEVTALAIEQHHAPEPPAALESRVAWVAEQLAAVFEAGIIEDLDAIVARAAELLAVPRASIHQILEEVPSLVNEAGTAFERDLGPQLDLQELKRNAYERLVELNRYYGETVAALRRVLSEKDALAKRLQLLNETLAEQALTDTLTGLPNRRAMEQALQRDVARSVREGVPLGVIMLDVDHFKDFNDRHGHLVGDEVLRSVAGVLVRSSRTSDLATRYGGEEFCVLLPNADVDSALLVGRRLRLAIERTSVPSEGGPLRVTASFGVAVLQPGSGPCEPEDLLRRADRALYAAKAAGRNQVLLAS